MFQKSFFKTFIILLITTLILGSVFITPAKATDPLPDITLEDYLTYFYNRYSLHLDEWGLVYKAPAYGVTNFQKAKSAREILSLATYYKYRAIQGENRARRIIRVAILNAEWELNSRLADKHSFSDAWAQMTMLSLIDQLPSLLSSDEQHKIQTEILSRAELGILAPDTSNRAALSAVYWQYIINNLYNQALIDDQTKTDLDKLIYKKIKEVLNNDVDSNGWYKEGPSMKFNPHYHLITALAFMSYAEITGDIEIYLMAKKMTKNLRAITFPNGMVEARIGYRPVGLGAQFYLGAGLLNHKFNYSDFATYLNYAQGDRFFSDPKYPNRLEYHSTIYNTSPDYHDDISFSNLAELALLTPSLANLEFSYIQTMHDLKTNINQADIQLVNQGQIIQFDILEIRQTQDGNSTNFYHVKTKQNLNQQVKGVSTINIQQTYNQPRLGPEYEANQIQEFYSELQKYFYGGIIPTDNPAFNTLTAAYIYGGYTLEEIVDTIKNGPRAVHPTIPANYWRETQNYQGYLDEN